MKCFGNQRHFLICSKFYVMQVKNSKRKVLSLKTYSNFFSVISVASLGCHDLPFGFSKYCSLLFIIWYNFQILVFVFKKEIHVVVFTQITSVFFYFKVRSVFSGTANRRFQTQASMASERGLHLTVILPPRSQFPCPVASCKTQRVTLQESSRRLSTGVSVSL